jgi:hypothetical protein
LQTETGAVEAGSQDCVDTVVAESGKLRSGRLKLKAEAGAARQATIRAMGAKRLITFSFL